MNKTTQSCESPVALPPNTTLTTAQRSARLKALSQYDEARSSAYRIAVFQTSLSKRFGRAIDVRSRLRLVAVTLLPTLLLGCSEPKVGASIVGYNHTLDRSIYYFTVNGSMGSNLSPDSGGGAYGCCVALPEKWRPGLKARIVWHYGYGTAMPVQPPSQKAEVEVPEYGPRMGNFNVHFYPDNKISVVVTPYAIGHADYPASVQWDLPTPRDATTGTALPFGPKEPEFVVPRLAPESTELSGALQNDSSASQTFPENSPRRIREESEKK